MNIQITKAFKDKSSVRPFAVSEFITVSEKVGKQWIAEGRAIGLDPKPKPTKSKRENASR
jgi:transposase